MHTASKAIRHQRHPESRVPVRDLMEKQINHSLRWQESIENMAADGFDTFIEVGVGTTLKKLISRILPDSKVYAVSNMEEARQVAEEVR